uniref:C2H2-type domain-containing protein n=1 Tax=Anopheles dirus TaxID=7168 RepID=A0A9I3EH62_9DIPT
MDCSLDDDIKIEDTKITPTIEEDYLEYEEIHVKDEISSDLEDAVTDDGSGDDSASSNNKRYGNPESRSKSPSIRHVYGRDYVYEIRKLPDNETIHKIDNNNVSLGNVSGSKDDDSRDEPKRTDRSHRCDHCQETFDCIGRLRKHERKHWMGECPICKKTIQVDNLKFHIGRMHPTDETPPANRPFRCDHCEKAFFYQYHLLIHERVHQVEKCRLCGETVRSSYLKNHMDRKHPGRGTPQQSGSSSYRCDECEQTFCSKTLLTSHQLNHKKAACPVCAKTFRYDSMKMHVATAHPAHGTLPVDRPYRCDECRRAFYYKKQLTKHQRTHKLVACGVCKKSFRSDYIKTHAARKH